MTRKKERKTMKKSTNLTKHLYHFRILMFFCCCGCLFPSSFCGTSFREGLPKIFFVGWGGFYHPIKTRWDWNIYQLIYHRSMVYMYGDIYQSHGAYGHETQIQLKSLGGAFQIYFKGIFIPISSFRWSNLTCAYYGLKMLKLEPNN